MLREISQVRQESTERVKRWYTSSDMDVFVWLNLAGQIESFHWSYNKASAEKALIWSQGNGFSHVGVDDGISSGNYPASPIFTEDNEFDRLALSQLFHKTTMPSESTILVAVVRMVRQHLGAIP